MGEQKPEKPSARSSSNTGRGHSWEGRGAAAHPLPRQPPQAARPAAVACTRAEAKLAKGSELCIIPAGQGRRRGRQLVQELQGRRGRTARRLTPAGHHRHLLCIIASAGWLAGCSLCQAALPHDASHGGAHLQGMETKVRRARPVSMAVALDTKHHAQGTRYHCRPAAAAAASGSSEQQSSDSMRCSTASDTSHLL